MGCSTQLAGKYLDVKAIIVPSWVIVVVTGVMHMEMQFIQLLSLFSGTGSNAAFVEHLDNIERWTGDAKDPKQVALPQCCFQKS